MTYHKSTLTHRLPITALVLLLTLFLAACGGAAEPTAAPAPTEPPQEPAAEPTEAPTMEEEPTAEEQEPAAEPTEAEGEAAGDVRIITHSFGDTEIEGVPQRIVALEWTYAEDLLALGIQPAGVADVAGYETWVNVEPALADSVVDVGTRQEPSLEAIAALEPDMIIGVQFRHEPIYADLSAIAPTLLFNPYPGEDGPDQYQEMRETFLTIAEAVQREDEAVQVLTEMEQTFTDAAALLDESGLENRQFALVQGFSSEGVPQVRLFTDNSMAVQILEQVGLENAWDGGFEVYGFSTVGIEGLANVQSANLLYVVQDDDNIFANQADNPVWNSLEFVQEERTYSLGGDTWLFGGPLSAELFVNQTVDLLTE